MTAEQQKLVPQRDEDLKAGNYTVINSEATKNFNVYVVGEKHKEAMDYINILLDRSTTTFSATASRWAARRSSA